MTLQKQKRSDVCTGTGGTILSARDTIQIHIENFLIFAKHWDRDRVDFGRLWYMWHQKFVLLEMYLLILQNKNEINSISVW